MLVGGIGDSGEARWEYFRNVVAVPSIKKTGGALRCALPCWQPLLRTLILTPAQRLCMQPAVTIGIGRLAHGNAPRKGRGLS